MKSPTSKRLLTLALVVLTLALALATALLPAAAEDNIASDQPVTVDAFSGSCGPRQITEDYCIRLNLGAPFTAIWAMMCTWTTTDSQASIALYKWSVDYNTTIKSEPIAYQLMDPLQDNSYNRLSFDEQPAGEYLFRVADIKGTVGVFTRDMSVSKSYCYTNGLESRADWWMKVDFTKPPVEPFLEVSSILDGVDGNHRPPEEYIAPNDALLNTHRVMPDTWVFTDGLGRESLTYEDVGPVKEGKEVAMFYWTWHISGGGEPLNTNQFMLENPDAKNDYDHPAWPENRAEPYGAAYFWNEPIYGYYRTTDEWVLRRQSELLANAGVDVIFTDNTNGGFTWKESYDVLYASWDKAQREGAVDTPKVSFMLNFYPFDTNYNQIVSLYLDIYRPGNYRNLWYYRDGLPMLMGCNDHFTNPTGNLNKEIAKFYSWRSTLIGGDETNPEYKRFGQWGWLSPYTQPVFYGTRENYRSKTVEQMTVGVSINYDYEKQQGTAMNGEHVMGRSYSSTYPDRYEKEGAEASEWGYFFSEQFDYALSKDPEVIFLTGWNEWTAGRQKDWGGIENAFADQFIDEFSRDIEPTKGELKDHYYYLMVNYVRKFKGVNPIPTPSTAQTIDLAAGNDQWSTAAPYYAAYIGNTADRDADGYGSNHYTETSGRNDIIGARVARDDDTVWFYVECNEEITPYTDALWMNLLIDSDQENQGWETFDYVVGKTPGSADTLVLEKFTDGYTSEKVADVKYKVDGKTMVIEIPKSALGLSGYDFTINFSWTDNVHDEGDYEKFSGDIMDFYISGDVAPGARFKFSYISTTENSGKVVETDTDAPTDAITEPETEHDASSETNPSETVPETDATAADTGCASAVNLFILPTLLAAAWSMRRRNPA